MNQASGDDSVSGQRAARTSSASAPYQSGSRRQIAASGEAPAAPLHTRRRRAAAEPRKKSRSANSNGKLARRNCAQRNCRRQTSAAAAPAEWLRKRRRDQAHSQPHGAHRLGGGRVLGDFGGERFEAAGAFEIGAPPQHGLALREARPDGVGDILPARLVTVEERSLDLGPQAKRPRAGRRRADHAGIGAPSRQRALDVIPRHQHVAVGHQEPAVRRRALALEHVVELGIAALSLVADQEPRRHLRIVPHQLLRQAGSPGRRGLRRRTAVRSWGNPARSPSAACPR